MSHLANCEKEFVVYLETISSGKVALVITVRLTYMICTGQDNAAVNPITNPNLTVFPCSRYTSHLVQQGALPIAVGLSCVPVVVWGIMKKGWQIVLVFKASSWKRHATSPHGSLAGQVIRPPLASRI